MTSVMNNTFSCASFQCLHVQAAASAAAVGADDEVTLHKYWEVICKKDDLPTYTVCSKVDIFADHFFTAFGQEVHQSNFRKLVKNFKLVFLGL